MEWERTKRPGIYKATTPTGTRYKVYWRDAGGEQRTKTFSRWKDAEDHANGIGHRRATGDLPDLERGKMTLRDLVDALHESRRYAPATLELHTVVLGRVGPLADRQLREITPEGVEAALEAIERPAMRDKTRRVLAAAFNFAASKGWIVRSPVRRPSTDRTRSATMQRRRSAGEDRKRYLSEAELARLIEATPERWRASIILMARMGLRPGEAMALRVGKLSPATEVPERRPATLLIDTSLSGFTKTGEPRELVLPAAVAEVLREHLARFCPDDADAPIFTTDGGRAISGKNSYAAWRRRWFAPAVEVAKLEASFTPNMLRHSAAAFAIANGANVYHVQRMLGHARPSITLDVYGALWDSSLGELADTLDAAIRKAQTG
jgi:integrase